MTFILRWLLILILLVFVAFSLFPAALVTLLQSHVNIPWLSPEHTQIAVNTSPVETGLWYGAAVFLLIAMIRLVRRTQAFWAWLIGFALYGGRWALVQQEAGGLLPALQRLTVDSFRPETLGNDLTAPAAQLVLIAALLLVGLLTAIVDHGDRKYWNAQAA